MSEDRAFQHLEQVAHGPVGTSDDGDVGLDHAFDDLGGDPGVPELTTRAGGEPLDCRPTLAPGQPGHRLGESGVELSWNLNHGPMLAVA